MSQPAVGRGQLLMSYQGSGQLQAGPIESVVRKLRFETGAGFAGFSAGRRQMRTKLPGDLVLMGEFVRGRY